MKAYIFDTINRYKRFSENLDVKTVLCNKTWLVFNDGGEKEVYIFQEDGSLIISLNGRVTNATWKYISANKSLIIAANEQSFMVNPAFTDSNIFALQIDGTNNYSFLIDKFNKSNFNPKSLNELQNYFNFREQKFLIEENIRNVSAKKEPDRIKKERLTQEQCESAVKCDKEAREEIAETLWARNDDVIRDLIPKTTWIRLIEILFDYPIFGIVVFLIFISIFIFIAVYSTLCILDYINVAFDIGLHLYNRTLEFIIYFIIASTPIIFVIYTIYIFCKEALIRQEKSTKDEFIRKFIEHNKNSNISDMKNKYKL